MFLGRKSMSCFIPAEKKFTVYLVRWIFGSFFKNGRSEMLWAEKPDENIAITFDLSLKLAMAKWSCCIWNVNMLHTSIHFIVVNVYGTVECLLSRLLLKINKTAFIWGIVEGTGAICYLLELWAVSNGVFMMFCCKKKHIELEPHSSYLSFINVQSNWSLLK